MHTFGLHGDILHVAAPPMVPPVPQQPCEPNRCGINAECLPVGFTGECRCLPNYFGNPYEACRPECTTDRECPFYLACVNEKCVDPCPGTCGINAECQVVNHAPVCYCKAGYAGDPYQACHIETSKSLSLKFFCYCFMNYNLVCCMCFGIPC